MDSARNRCYSKAGLAEGTDANTFKIAAPNGAGVDYSVKGRLYHKADTDNIAFSAGHTALAATQQCIFGVCLNAAGTVSTIQGPIKTVGNDEAVLQWPAPSDDLCMIGGILVETAAATTFTPGSTDLGAAGVTDTYIDCDGAPPQNVSLY